MFRPTHKVHFLYFCVDLVIISLCFFIAYLFQFNLNSVKDLHFSNLIFHNVREYLYIFIIWGILIVTSLQRKSLYSTDRTLTIPKETFLVLTSIFYVSIAVSTIVFFIQLESFSRSIFISCFINLCVFLTLWRILKRSMLRYLIANGFHNFNVLIIGTDVRSKLLFEEIRSRPYLGLKVVGALDNDSDARNRESSIPVLGELSDFEKVSKEYFIDEVFISNPSQEKTVSKITKIAKNMHIGVRIMPINAEEEFPLLNLDFLGSIPLLTVKERQIHPADLFLKRIFDLLIAIPLTIILSPLFLIISFLIKIDSPGPVFYIQKRTGRKGEVFKLYKFRSMVKDADRLKTDLLKENEVKDGVIFKMKSDPRVTRVGRFLRKYSLDETPQLFNVIKGDISLVGPRPFPVKESEGMSFHHMPRLNIRPGITGLAQVRGRSDLTFYKWAKLDLWYINNWSFGLDLKILWWTIPEVLKARGAY